MDRDQAMEWLQLAVRWLHVFAGILWIGSTWFFTWLDHRIHEGAARGERGVYMVHSGGFYVVEKQASLSPMPPKIHWFRYEALVTWITGVLLLALVFYLGGVALDADNNVIPAGRAAGMGFGLLLVGWIAYDLFWASPLGRNEVVGLALGYAAVVGLAYGLTTVFNGRAAYIHLGALFGTIMTANVWMRILPAQRRMIAASRGDGQLDPVLGERAKQRSKHNTFLVVPLVFIMLSNHFPTTTYGTTHGGWIPLAALVLVGWIAAGVARRLWF